jgi:hypothetical protein
MSLLVYTSYMKQRRRLQEDLESAATRLGMAQPVST